MEIKMRDPRIEMSISNFGSAQVIVALKQDVAKAGGKEVPSKIAENLSRSLPEAFSAKSALSENIARWRLVSRDILHITNIFMADKLYDLYILFVSKKDINKQEQTKQKILIGG